MEALIIVSNCFVGVVTLHLAHRALPEEHKHWIRARARQCLACLPLISNPYQGQHRRE